MNRYLDVAPEVQEALKAGKPVVALESTIISHGMPYPQNVETALNVEKIIRDGGAVPATIAIIGGRLKAGLTPEEIDYLGKTGAGVTKASRRDLPILVAEGRDGATTVTTTMMIAAMAGISVFATGGIGGVHRGAETTMDISADLEELAQTPVMVVCAGAKSILDLGLKYTPIAAPNKDAQFVENKEVSIRDIARYFGVPLYKLQEGKQAYGSNEQNAIEYVVSTLHPIVNQYAEEQTWKLLTNTELRQGLEIRINMMAELKGDTASRGAWYTNQRNNGVFSVNDIRALEDLPDVEGGDERRESLNFVPLKDWARLSEQRNGGNANAGNT